MPKLSAVSWKRLAKIFERAGWSCARIEGDHMVFTKPGAIRPIAKMSRDEYFRLLSP